MPLRNLNIHGSRGLMNMAWVSRSIASSARPAVASAWPKQLFAIAASGVSSTPSANELSALSLCPLRE